MFRIECFCDDKRLAEILNALNGKAYQVSAVPVANVKKAGGTLRQANGSAVEALMAGIQKRKLKDVGATDMKAIMVEAGFAEGGYSNALAQARSFGLLKAIPAENNKYVRYKIMPPKAKAKSKSKGASA
jgi:hypothetical protein